MIASLLPQLHQRLQWPEPDNVLNPAGAGSAIYQRLARLKIEAPLARELGRDQVRVGILSGNPTGKILSANANVDFGSTPIALVCEFNHALAPNHLNLTRKLAWNFCRTPLLITLEPHLLRVWSCFERPNNDGYFLSEPVVSAGDRQSLDLSSIYDTLHWAQLASGQFLARHSDRFDSNQRADHLLLENLRYVRERLTHSKDAELRGLEESVAHDLLARVIFVQFLMDRRDAQGNAALNERKLADLADKGILSKKHSDLSSILNSKQDTFALFKWLNVRFNGDLFPSNYSEEERKVEKHHLQTLADFVGGQLQMGKGQFMLWQHYSFDTMPLEFISSIYEEFVTKRKDDEKGIGEHYTRPFLVDFILDKVLPWGGKEYDLKILDPCCGSAVFLVKAFQRMVQRWRNANPDQEPPVSFLRGLLENNLLGVDIEEKAVHVASFSLYLAMCDEIDPKHYWTQIRFPSLREKRICAADFFSEDVVGIRTVEDAGQYDLITGNPPWGEGSLSDKAREWAKNKENGPWPTSNEQIGTLFLAKAARLCKSDGYVCMIQPAGALLFNVNDPARSFREKLFSDYKVDEIVNLSALRFTKLFPNAVSPACIIKMRPIPPDGEAIEYWAPKQARTIEEQLRVVIDEQDLNWIWPEEAAMDSTVWPALALGGRRDLNAIHQMRSHAKTLQRLESEQGWRVFSGFKRVEKRAKDCPERIGIPCVESLALFWKAPYLVSADFFPDNNNPKFEREHSLDTFALPLLIVSRSWKNRFKAIVVRPTKTKKHLLYSESFFAISGPNEKSLQWMASILNSPLSVYYLYLNSGRLASYRPTIRKADLLALPFPELLEDKTSNASLISAAFGLSSVENALIDDFSKFSLPDFKAAQQVKSPGCAAVWTLEDSCNEIETYSDWFLRVLRSGFGSDKAMCATIFRMPNPCDSPFCMAGIHLDWRRRDHIQYQDVTDGSLLRILQQQNQDTLSSSTEPWAGIYYRRVSRIYQRIAVEDHGNRFNVPTVILIKPNQVRYWTRSAALRDADNVAAEIMKHGQEGSNL
ncbi:MAG: N-6 DNA methylase [Candidatus Sumerlaeota bacterium]|nr:N-6 DNA methylase [Candidatus Sumerlaeota bacterium]